MQLPQCKALGVLFTGQQCNYFTTVCCLFGELAPAKADSLEDTVIKKPSYPEWVVASS